MESWIKNILSAVALLQILCLASCDEDPPGYNQPINPLWEYDYNAGYSGSIIPIVDEGIVVFSSFKERRNDLSSNDKLIGLNKKTGALLWEWSDLFWDNYEQFGRKSMKSVTNNILAFAIGGRNYGINLIDGTTKWRNQTATSMGNIRNNRDMIYRVNIYYPEDKGIYCDQLLAASIHDGNWGDVIFEVRGGDSLRQALTVPTFYRNIKGDENLIMANTVLNENINSPKFGFVTPYLISYNYTKQEQNYEIQLDQSGLYSRVDWVPIIADDKVYLLVGSLMVCHDIETGKRIWARRFSGDFLFSRAIIEDGVIYANRDGLDYTLYGINAENGSILWETRSSGTSSPLQYHKGVLYFIGGDGLFHIVNAATGEYIHKITAPSAYSDPDDFFSSSSGCTVDPETDRIYLSSQTRAYCYPTVNLK